jgi:hypothetical protein
LEAVVKEDVPPKAMVEPERNVPPAASAELPDADRLSDLIPPPTPSIDPLPEKATEAIEVVPLVEPDAVRVDAPESDASPPLVAPPAMPVDAAPAKVAEDEMRPVVFPWLATGYAAIGPKPSIQPLPIGPSG